ncbi:carbohydrate deacetylase-like [Asterias amurensis]|uniref:carbohydrate deacetylase-like n=1 Tax=Asterias amurensis TaxID=7602 RepID=UPI003AB29658
MNAPPTFESFILYEGDKKITIEKDTKVPNAAIFHVNKEDHTLGNMLRQQLLKDPQVLFAGYKVPHPLENKFVLRVQTTPDYSPQEAFTNAITDLISEISLLEERFKLALKFDPYLDQKASQLTVSASVMDMTATMPSKVLLIINADDFGHCIGRNQGIVECYKKGLISSATLMVNGRATKDAVKQAKELGIPLGLHLNLTEGSVTNRGRCDSLVDESTGCLRGKLGFRKALASGVINKDELKNEITAQFSYYQELTGHAPTHVDGHQHVHILPGLREILTDVAKEFGVGAVRVPLQYGVPNCDWLTQHRREFFGEVKKDGAEARALFLKKGLKVPDGFLGLSTMGQDMKLPTLTSALETTLNSCMTSDLSPRVTLELMVHPGFPCQQGCGLIGEEFFCFKDRSHEMRILGDEHWKEVMTKTGIHLGSFKDL